jgi:hypothetical protein
LDFTQKMLVSCSYDGVIKVWKWSWFGGTNDNDVICQHTFTLLQHTHMHSFSYSLFRWSYCFIITINQSTNQPTNINLYYPF